MAPAFYYDVPNRRTPRRGHHGVHYPPHPTGEHMPYLPQTDRGPTMSRPGINSKFGILPPPHHATTSGYDGAKIFACLNQKIEVAKDLEQSPENRQYTQALKNLAKCYFTKIKPLEKKASALERTIGLTKGTQRRAPCEVHSKCVDRAMKPIQVSKHNAGNVPNHEEPFKTGSSADTILSMEEISASPFLPIPTTTSQTIPSIEEMEIDEFLRLRGRKDQPSHAPSSWVPRF